MLTNRFERALQLGRCVASGIEIQYFPLFKWKVTLFDEAARLVRITSHFMTDQFALYSNFELRNINTHT